MARATSEFRRVLLKLGAALDGDVGKLVSVLAAQSPAEALALITDAYPEMVTPYLSAAADLTATWYEDQPGGDVDFLAEPAELPEIDQLAVNGRWALTQATPATALKGAARRQLFKQHRDTVILNADREGVAWVREARRGACGFCRMLATRVITEGFGGAPGLYLSEGTASQTPHTEDATGHDHCRCIAVPIRGGEPYKIPGYVHGWLEDYDAVSRDENGRLLPVWKIAEQMEQRGAQRGEPVAHDDGTTATPAPAERKPVDLDADRRESTPVPTPQLAIEAPKRQLALERKPQPLAIEAARQPLMLTAAPTRPAVTVPDVGAIAEWLDAEDEHRAALDYWRRVDDENLHSVPAAEQPEPAIVEQRPPVEPPVEIPADPAPVADVQVDDHRGESPMDDAVRALEEAMAAGDDDEIERAADALDALEEAERRDVERKAKAAERRQAAADADQDRILALIEDGEDPQLAEAEVLASNADGRRRVAKVIADNPSFDEDEAGRVVYNHILERIRRRDFMAQARADGHTGKGFDDLVDSVFWRRVEELSVEAENATRGAMTKREYQLTFDPKRLWYVNEATARKYMSEEMAQWFDDNGRLTRPVFRQMILDGSSNFGSYTVLVGDFRQ